MPKLNESRIVKRRNGFFPFNYEGGTIGMFQTYYVVEEWYAPNDYWGILLKCKKCGKLRKKRV